MAKVIFINYGNDFQDESERIVTYNVYCQACNSNITLSDF